ncbi:MAG: D-glycero-beta-D-manno-heptose-7-phosphate kinase [Isosphaeraceae bacterium]
MSDAENHARLRKAVADRFGGRRVLVVGDLMLDAYVWGEVARVSPEAPVLVVRLDRRTANPGGAGNVMLNLAALGIEARAAGFVGRDQAGEMLVGLLDQAGIRTAGIRRWDDRPTITKTRIVGGHQQVLRLDEESDAPVPDAAIDALLASAFVQLREGVDAVILSDYAKGTLTPGVCRAVIDEARRLGLPVLADPKGRDYSKYSGATTLTPNRHELEAATGLPAILDEDIRAAAARLREHVALDFLVVTRGEHGIGLFDGRGARFFPAMAREVFDVSGAGDTVIATFTAGLVAGLPIDEALHLANLAAGVVVGKIGTVPIDRGELLDAIRTEQAIEQSDKVADLDNLLPRIERWRANRDRIVFTNGCFDLLHVGHVTLLAQAKALGDRLIVGLNSDASVRRLKGETRPVTSESDRAHVLAALGSVDAVVLFGEDTPLRLIEAIRPEILVKGGDYAEDEVVGGDFVRSHGGRVALVPIVEGRSTTRIVNKLQGDPADTKGS